MGTAEPWAPPTHGFGDNDGTGTHMVSSPRCRSFGSHSQGHPSIVPPLWDALQPPEGDTPHCHSRLLTSRVVPQPPSGCSRWYLSPSVLVTPQPCPSVSSPSVTGLPRRLDGTITESHAWPHVTETGGEMRGSLSQLSRDPQAAPSTSVPPKSPHFSIYSFRDREGGGTGGLSHFMLTPQGTDVTSEGSQWGHRGDAGATLGLPSLQIPPPQPQLLTPGIPCPGCGDKKEQKAPSLKSLHHVGGGRGGALSPTALTPGPGSSPTPSHPPGARLLLPGPEQEPLSLSMS